MLCNSQRSQDQNPKNKLGLSGVFAPSGDSFPPWKARIGSNQINVTKLVFIDASVLFWSIPNVFPHLKNEDKKKKLNNNKPQRVYSQITKNSRRHPELWPQEKKFRGETRKCLTNRTIQESNQTEKRANVSKLLPVKTSAETERRFIHSSIAECAEKDLHAKLKAARRRGAGTHRWPLSKPKQQSLNLPSTISQSILQAAASESTESSEKLQLLHSFSLDRTPVRISKATYFSAFHPRSNPNNYRANIWLTAVNCCVGSRSTRFSCESPNRTAVPAGPQ